MFRHLFDGKLIKIQSEIINHKKAQKTQKYFFENFAPFCGYN
jgi:aerobic-type carbon monoxide dehydrogenase small subunit (CoxS/CutS family)